MNKASFILTIVIMLLTGCAEDESKPFVVDPTDLTGIWVPYERVLKDGSSFPIEPSSSIFGFYAESFKWKADDTYIPVLWQSADHFGIMKNTGGNIKRIGNEVHFTDGQWDMKFRIVKQKENELWFEYIEDMATEAGIILKLERMITGSTYQ